MKVLGDSCDISQTDHHHETMGPENNVVEIHSRHQLRTNKDRDDISGHGMNLHRWVCRGRDGAGDVGDAAQSSSASRISTSVLQTR
jgi:hypothetical protein